MNIREAKEKVLYWSKQGYDHGLFAGTSGNLSIFLPEDKLIVITPGSVRYETMLIEDIVVTDMDGVKQEGHQKPSSEFKLHRAVYAAGLAKSVVHTHSPFATAFAVNRQAIPLCLIEMAPFLGGDVHCTPFQLPGTEALANAAVSGLQDRNACLLSNHGVVAIGESIEVAYIRAEYVEDAAKICKLASIGGEVTTVQGLNK
ncbi:MAG: class II aldolase/adducin family protein [Chloroflexota bacterium]|jgi:L-ribulose-5-phosphate 4-epimerase|nr:class II aldolase/adducin family protein [Chloroflexota bacterium]